MEANNDEVICPACVHQFRAIPVNVQAEIAALRSERDALAAKLTTLKADAERLDYLQQGVTIELIYEGLAPRFRVAGNNSGTHSNLRSAIDAAKGGQQ